jgi:tetratricopeptide (TPR) repeat protein
MKDFNLKRLTVFLLLTQVVFFASAAVTEYPDEILNSIRANRYLAESLRLQKLAQQLYAGGDYDQAVKCASDAVKAATVSDIYVKQQIKIYVANNKISDALQRLAWADLSEVKQSFPSEFYNAKTYYNLGLIARDARKWDDAISNADKVIETLALVNIVPSANTQQAVSRKTPAAAPEKSPLEKTVPAVTAAATVMSGTVQNNTPPDADTETPLPAQYVVRSWDKYGDCFWNIAGYSWVYGDPHQWTILYQANKNKIPNPKNPDLIEQDMVMEIPSINGEKRLGTWDAKKTYTKSKK